MTAIWHQGPGGWRALAPVGFPDEASLHALIDDAPQLLPLAGNPQLVVLGREVLLGGNSADLIAVEPTGRLAVIEIKLSKNSEARRAVIAQILTYAAYLQGQTYEALEHGILSRHLNTRGYSSVADAVARNDQEGMFDLETFESGLAESLATGQFRLVIVLDSAPVELVRLVGYLSSMSDKLLIDLVTVSAYEVDGARVMVPQRVDPEPRPTPSHINVVTLSRTIEGLTEGADAFVEAIEERPEAERQTLRQLVSWARQLESQGLVRLQSYRGKTRTTLLPRLQPENAGLVTIATQPKPLWLFRSVWERRAPASISRIEELLAPQPFGQGTTVAFSEALLDVLTAAHREAGTAAPPVS